MLGLHHKYFLEHGNLHEQGATGRAKGAFIYSYFFPTSLLFVEEEYIRVTRIFFSLLLAALKSISGFGEGDVGLPTFSSLT